jgi:hypothetical protein
MATATIARRQSANRRLLRLLTIQREIAKEVLEVAYTDPRFIRCPNCSGPVREIEPDWVGRQRAACDAIEPCRASSYPDAPVHQWGVAVHLVESIQRDEAKQNDLMAQRSTVWRVA